jgi:hypothetical protein
MMDEPHNYTKPLPAWVQSVHVRVSKGGRTWAITVHGAMDSRSKMPGKDKRYYWPRAWPEDHAVNRSLHRAQWTMRVRWQGSCLCQEARATLGQEEGKVISETLRGKYGVLWLYTSEDAQKELRDLIQKARR